MLSEKTRTREELEAEITAIFNDNKQRYGYQRVTCVLRRRGLQINHKKIQQLTKKLGLIVTKFTQKSRSYNSYRGTIGSITKNLIHWKFYTSVPHQKLTTDTTEFKYYIKDKNGNLVIKKTYLDSYLDMFNSEIISYLISKSPNSESMITVQLSSIEKTNDCSFRRTFHSDQG